MQAYTYFTGITDIIINIIVYVSKMMRYFDKKYKYT